MAVTLSDHLLAVLPELRCQPVLRRVRVRLGGELVAETDRPMLVWEPMRIVPDYAVPAADLRVTPAAADPGPAPEYRPVGFGADDRPLLDPGVPFAVHTAEGEPLTITAAGRSGEAFRPADDRLNGYLVLRFADFDWEEEDEPIVGHPRDPFHRIEVRRSSRHVRLEHEGRVLADSRRPQMLFEGAFPLPRFYLPVEDVTVPLVPGTLRTTCAYKGHATHYSVAGGGPDLADIAWSYHDPLSDAAAVKDLVSFYHERLDLTLDGRPVERIRTPWSTRS